MTGAASRSPIAAAARCMRKTAGRAFEAAVADGADAIECDVQATARRRAGRVSRPDARRCVSSVASFPPPRSRHGARALALLADVPRLRGAARRSTCSSRSRIRARPCAVARMVEASGWSSTTRARQLSRTRAGRGRELAAPGVRTSFMMGSVAGATELIRARRSVCRADGVHLCWKRGAPQPHRLLLGADLIATVAPAPAWRSRCGTRSASDELRALDRARARTRSAPICRPCCGGSWMPRADVVSRTPRHRGTEAQEST